MGWRGFIKSVNAASNRAAKAAGSELRRRERVAMRTHRELQRQAQEAARLTSLENARLEVAANENSLECLISIHKDQGPTWDWPSIVNSPPPLSPVRNTRPEALARAALQAFDPSLLERVSGQASKEKLRLEAAVRQTQSHAELEFQRLSLAYRQEWTEWKEMCSLAQTVIEGNPQAYLEALQEINPFQEISDFGSTLEVKVHSSKLLEIRVFTKGKQIIPQQVLTLSATGKVSRKGMPKGRFNEILQDYICGSALRVGREAFALLPIHTVLVNVIAPLLDPSTGHTTKATVLSVAFPRQQFQSLNFDRIDPSESMVNFVSRDCFRNKKRGVDLAPVRALEIHEICPQPIPSTISPQQHAPPSRSAVPDAVGTSSPKVLQQYWERSSRVGEGPQAFLILTANELSSLLGHERRDRFTAGQSSALAERVATLGFCMEPDARITGNGLAGAKRVGIFPAPGGVARPPSVNYLGAAALLSLVLMVATAQTDKVRENEIEEFRKFLEASYDFRLDEHLRLVVLEALMIEAPGEAQIGLGKIKERVPPHQRILIARLLVRIAWADGILHPKEHAILRRIFGALELDNALLQSLIQAELPSPDGTVTVAPSAPGRPSEIIPDNPPAPRFRLNMDRVAAITLETNQVISILAEALQEPVPASAPAPVSVLAEEVTVRALSPDQNRSVPKVAMQQLEPKLRPLVRALISKATWAETDFHNLTERYGLMPLQAVDIINSWSDEALGDFLLLGEADVTINFQLLSTP